MINVSTGIFETGWTFGTIFRVHRAIVTTGLLSATEYDTGVIPATFSNNNNISTTKKALPATNIRKIGTQNWFSTLAITEQSFTRRSVCIVTTPPNTGFFGNAKKKPDRATLIDIDNGADKLK